MRTRELGDGNQKGRRAFTRADKHQNMIYQRLFDGIVRMVRSSHRHNLWCPPSLPASLDLTSGTTLRLTASQQKMKKSFCTVRSAFRIQPTDFLPHTTHGLPGCRHTLRQCANDSNPGATRIVLQALNQRPSPRGPFPRGAVRWKGLEGESRAVVTRRARSAVIRLVVSACSASRASARSYAAKACVEA